METYTYVPCSPRLAAYALRLALTEPLSELPKQTFIMAWSSIAYLYPGLHPDGYEQPNSGWPRVLKKFVAEAWLRFETDEFSEADLYQSEAAWCGIFDNMDKIPTTEETERRALAAALHGLPSET